MKYKDFNEEFLTDLLAAIIVAAGAALFVYHVWG
jgi:hypothetical protein